MPTATRVRDQCLSPSRAVDAPVGEGRYQRLFPELPPLDCDDDALHALGRAGPAGRSSGSSWPTTSPPTARP
jgi:hypothetical protein